MVGDEGLASSEARSDAPLFEFFVQQKWWVMRGSNPRPSRCKRDALAN